MGMVATYRSNVDFQRLVTDCWDILRGQAYPFFPGTTPSGPSLVVFVGPNNFDTGWWWELWSLVVAPLLTKLASEWSKREPPPMGRKIVEAYLGEALKASPWAKKVLWG